MPLGSRLYPAVAGSAFFTAANTFSTEGMEKNPFLATNFPSTSTVSSPWSPSMSCTSTPGSFLKAAARLAARSRVEPQTGHWRMITFFMACTPFIETGEFRVTEGMLRAKSGRFELDTTAPRWIWSRAERFPPELATQVAAEGSRG
jgi:hypothetical protein